MGMSINRSGLAASLPVKSDFLFTLWFLTEPRVIRLLGAGYVVRILKGKFTLWGTSVWENSLFVEDFERARSFCLCCA